MNDWTDPRTGLHRRTPLRARSHLRASRDTGTARIVRLRASQRASRRQRDAAAELERTRRIVRERAEGLCEMCGYPLDAGMELSHRNHDGMGGAGPENQRPSNLMASCRTIPGFRMGCNDYLETAQGREAGFRLGWLVEMGQDPLGVPVRYRGQRVLLTDDGGVIGA